MQSLKCPPGTYDLLAHLISKIARGLSGLRAFQGGIGLRLLHIHLLDCSLFFGCAADEFATIGAPLLPLPVLDEDRNCCFVSRCLVIQMFRFFEGECK